MTQSARFKLRAHPFMDGEIQVIDTAPTHRLAATVDSSEASESIVSKAARQVEEHGASLSDVIAIAWERNRRLVRLLNQRRIRAARQRSNEIADAAQEAYEIAHR